MRIAQVCEVFWPSRGGVETYIHNASRELVRRGHQVDIITGAVGGEPAVQVFPEGFRVVRLDNRAHWMVRTFRDGEVGVRRQALWIPCVAAHLARHGGAYDVIHAHMVPSLVGGVLAGRARRLVWSNHGSYCEVAGKHLGLHWAAFYEIAERIAFHLPYRRCVAVSRHVRRLACEHFHVSGRRVVAVHAGVDFDLFRPLGVSKPPDWPEGFHIVVASRLTPLKGVDVLIRAMPALLEARPDIRLLIYGGGPVTKSLLALSDSLGLGDRVRFCGIVDHRDVPNILNAADLVALPSLSEGFPLSVLEAMACGRPLVTCPVGGIPEIAPVETVVYAKPNDVSSLRDAVLRVAVQMSARQREDLGRRACEHVRSHFSWGETADRLLEIYGEAARD